MGLVVLIARSFPAGVVRDARRLVGIQELVVSIRVRRIEVGRSLIEASKTWTRERGIRNLEVSAWSFKEEAIEFYHKVGFQQTNELFTLSSV
jgi:ribosomal protein S18 acetylase RimI-like enzyme